VRPFHDSDPETTFDSPVFGSMACRFGMVVQVFTTEAVPPIAGMVTRDNLLPCV
jgi:hypothetical protein